MTPCGNDDDYYKTDEDNDDDDDEQKNLVTLEQSDVNVEQLSQKYAKHVGDYCPICNSDNLNREVDVDDIQDDGSLIVHVYCYDCNSDFGEVFRFVKLDDVQLEDDVTEFEMFPDPDAPEVEFADWQAEFIGGAKPTRTVVSAGTTTGTPTDWNAE